MEKNPGNKMLGHRKIVDGKVVLLSNFIDSSELFVMSAFCLHLEEWLIIMLCNFIFCFAARWLCLANLQTSV